MDKNLNNQLPGLRSEPGFQPGKKEVEDPGVGKFKRSGHLTDQILKYHPKKQLSIWDSLAPTTKQKIEADSVEVKSIVDGIRLSPSEQKVIDSLTKLLHEKSQNRTPEDSTYYTGNAGAELVQYGDTETPAPKMAFTIYELTKEYKGGDYVGGKDIENVKNILQELNSRRYLIKYIETTHQKGGGRTERKIETYSSLLQVVELTETEYSGADIELSKTEETVIVLNPIFRRQIDSKYLLLPNDINQRTIEAYGSHNISEITLRLRDYLVREHSSRRFTPEISIEKLYWTLSDKWMKESRKKKVREYTEKALQVCKDIGILKSYTIETGAKGEKKMIFSLDKDWK